MRGGKIALMLAVPTLLLSGCGEETGDSDRQAREALKEEIAERHPACKGLPFEGAYAKSSGLFLQCAIYSELKRLNDNLEAGK